MSVYPQRVFRKPGDRFGSLVLVASGARNGRHAWICKCDCGNEVAVRIDGLTSGKTDCGCKSRRAERHGLTDTPTYKSWSSMKTRCLNPNAADYADYGGRGISICDRWHSFSAFLEDMGPRPPGMTLDRKNPDADYAPDNCRWADASTQAKNKRGARKRVADQVDDAIADVIAEGRASYSQQDVVQLLARLRRRITGDGGTE